MFMAAAIAATGLPPLSGFIGKLLILKSVTAQPDWGWSWGVILGTTLIGVIGFARAGSVVFWKETGSDDTDSRAAAAAPRGDLLAPVIALVLLAALAAGAGPATAYADEAAAQVLDRAAAARAVLGEDAQ
jgi:multicomponent K+:H+ antiporter subunit D